MGQGLGLLVRRELSRHESNVKKGTDAISLNHTPELIVIDPTNVIIMFAPEFDDSPLVHELHSQVCIIR